MNNELHQIDQNARAGDVVSICMFEGGALHAQSVSPSNSTPCISQNKQYSDFVYEVQMRIIRGDCGGVVFRFNSIGGYRTYVFEICTSGEYGFLFDQPPALQNIPTGNNTSPAIARGPNASNLIAVVARGNDFAFYVNNQAVVDKVLDNNLSTGLIGVFVSTQKHPTEAAFSNAKVWTLL